MREIYYIEDDQSIAQLVKQYLEERGFAVSIYKDSSGARQAFQDHMPEIVLLARIDAGTLQLRREKTDVFTLLILAEENLQELFSESGVSIEISENEAAESFLDLEWTMEAVMNLMKNCMEHSVRGQKVHCCFEKNLLYVSIRIWDEGEGFAEEELPHLFERFYRGKNAADGSIGIGLALAKEIVEMQNGVISARNLPSGGACFELRFYSH